MSLRPLRDDHCTVTPGNASSEPTASNPTSFSDIRSRLSVERSRDDRVITGVAGGIASSLGVDSSAVRLGFAVLTLVGGVGIVIYLLALTWSTPPSAEPPPGREVTSRHTAGFACVVVGIIWFLHAIGILILPAVTIPIALVLGGAAVAWGRSPLQELVTGRHAVWRLLVGSAVLIVGVGVFLTQSNAFSSLWAALFAVTASVAGLLLLLAPWVVRLGHEVSQERRDRIRADARAEMSAHLHDSVLHTLALIQRSDAPPEVQTLARRQERELRAWMQGREADSEDTFREMVESIANRVEAAHNVSVDIVVVGDASVDNRIRLFGQAMQEAALNAAKHSGASNVSVYAEASGAEVTGYVRDAGRGFDRRDVEPDRRGIADSIEGRMRSAGGSVEFRTTPGKGTEVEFHLPLETQGAQ